jgi:hypothetical protein
MAAARDDQFTADDFPPLPPPGPLERMESNYYNPLMEEEKRQELQDFRNRQVLDVNQKPNDDQTPNCLCGKRAGAHQIKKEESKDKGKWFFTCSKRRADPTACPFWELQGGPAYKAPELAPSDVTCDCRQQACVRTSVKPGKNQGFKYYSCLNKQCQFFRWVKGR